MADDKNVLDFKSAGMKRAGVRDANISKVKNLVQVTSLLGQWKNMLK